MSVVIGAGMIAGVDAPSALTSSSLFPRSSKVQGRPIFYPLRSTV